MSLARAREMLINTDTNEIMKFVERKIDMNWDIDNYKSDLRQLKIHVEVNFDNLLTELGDSYGISDKYPAIHYVVSNILYNAVMNAIRTVYFNEDLQLFNNCMLLNKENITAEYFGANKNLNFSLTSAVVELSQIDSYREVGEKIQCLYNTYDLIFAEFKHAMIGIISESEEDYKIPIINNNDIMPLVTWVIVKSKIRYFHSNLYYIKYFDMRENYENDEDFCKIFDTFENAIEDLQEIRNEDLEKSRNSKENEIDYLSFMILCSSGPNNEIVGNAFRIEEQNRLISLYTKFSEENDGSE